MGETIGYDAVRDFAERWVDRWNAHAVEDILALVSEDVSWEDPVMEQTAHGRDAAREYISTLFRAFPDIEWAMPGALHVAPEGSGADGVTRVAQVWVCRGTVLGPLDPPGFAPTGRAFELRGVDLWDLRHHDGRLCRVTSHYDALGWARDVGLVPARGTRSELLLVLLQRLGARARRALR